MLLNRKKNIDKQIRRIKQDWAMCGILLHNEMDTYNSLQKHRNILTIEQRKQLAQYGNATALMNCATLTMNNSVVLMQDACGMMPKHEDICALIGYIAARQEDNE